MSGARRWLGFAYVFPAALFALGAWSLWRGYLDRVTFLRCAASSNAGCLDALPYFVLEAAVFGVAGYLAYRAVKRTRKAKKDLWTMRVYWPGVLVAFGVIALVTYGIVVTPSRGCDVGAATPVYVGYGCWDPGVTLFRTALAGLVTAGFMTTMTRIPEWTGDSRTLVPKERDAPTDAAADDEDEATEEIPAR